MKIDTTKRDNTHTEWYDRVCKWCGREFTTSYVHQVFCQDQCREDHNNEKARGKWVKKVVTHWGERQMKWRVLHDPDQEYGLLNTLRMTQNEIKPMLKLRSFTVGTVLEYVPTHKKYVVELDRNQFDQVMRPCNWVEAKRRMAA